MKMLEDFVKFKPVDNSIISKYTGQLPNEIIQLWSEYGFGSFCKGFFKVINPEEYDEILKDSYERGMTSIPVLATGLADLVVWEDNEYMRIVKHRYGFHETLSAGAEYFFDNLIYDEDFFNIDIEWEQYLEAVTLHEAIEYDECFGYVPLLGLGGTESAESLQKVKIKEHIVIISQFMGPVSND